MATVTYNIARGTLYEAIYEEISRVADTAYTDAGVSMYDEVIPTSRDDDEVTRLEDDAARSLANRMSDACMAMITDGTEIQLDFNLPAYVGIADAASEITRYIVLSVCAGWFRAKLATRMKEYADRAQVAMAKAVQILKTTIEPTLNRS